MGDRKIHWRCFHCDATFTKAQARWAREHFGRDEGEEPVCLIRSAGESALLTALRNAQDELAAHRAEDTDLMRALWSMQADHGVALRREEERGYAKGLADGRAEGAPAAEPATGDGWVYNNPDVGMEYAPNHPVTSGEVPDATDVRASTQFEDWLVREAKVRRPDSEPAAFHVLRDMLHRGHTITLDRLDSVESLVTDPRQWAARVLSAHSPQETREEIAQSQPYADAQERSLQPQQHNGEEH